MNELFKRVIVGVIFVPLLLYIFYLGNYVLLGFLSILTLYATYELINLFKQKKLELNFFLIPLSLGIFLASSYGKLNLLFLNYFVTSILIVGIDLFKNRINDVSLRVSTSLFSITYSGLFFSAIYKIRELQDGGTIIIALLIMIWLTDTSAYFLGMSIGKHRGIFQASPKKSLEGFVAGIVFSFIFAFVTMLIFPEIFSLKLIIFLAISTGIFGQFGDLFESMLKRDAKIKDSSKILPGHGGILDRFDSLLIAAPVFYLLVTFG